MERTLTIRHNWTNRNDSKWLFWLEKKVAELGFAVSLADLPEIAVKNTAAAVTEIQHAHGISENNTHIVRHDPGCLTLLKYCEHLLKQNSLEPILLVAGIPKRDTGSFSVLKMIGGPKALTVRHGEAGEEIEYSPEPEELTYSTMDIKLMLVYGGELPMLESKVYKSLPVRE